MRVLTFVVFCTAVLAEAVHAQGPADGPGATPQPTVMGAADRWVVDSQHPQKNRRQMFWAAIAAKDTVVGKYNTSRPVLQLFCFNNAKTLRLQIHTDQLILGRTNAMGARVGWTSVMVQRDDQPEQKVAWLFSMDSDVIGPEEKDRKSLDEVVASSRYRIGMMLNPVGRRYVEFDLTGIAERADWVATHCRNAPKHYSK